MKNQFSRCLVIVATIIIALSLSACEIFDNTETFSDDVKNNKPSSEVKIPISPEEYDTVLASGDGYVNGESKKYGSDHWYFIVDKEGHITDLNLERTSSFSPLSDGFF